MKRTYLSALAALTFASSAFACGSEPYLGDICVTANAYCPVGYVEANGQLLQVSQYQALYSLFGTTYGGTPNVNFNLPDLRGRTPVGIGTGIKTDNSGYLSTIQLGQKRGQEGVTLTASNLPAHIHPFTPMTGNQNVTIPATAGSGTTLSGTVGVVPDTANTAGDMKPSAGTTYQLAGTTASGSTTVTGPYTNAALPATPAKISGVSVDASGMTPAIPAKTVAIMTVTGGAVGANTTPNAPVATVPPQLGLRYCIAISNALYPPRP